MQTFSEWFLGRITEGYDTDPPPEVQQRRLYEVTLEVLTHMGATAALVYSDTNAVRDAYSAMLEQGFASGIQSKTLHEITSKELQ